MLLASYKTYSAKGSTQMELPLDKLLKWDIQMLELSIWGKLEKSVYYSEIIIYLNKTNENKVNEPGVPFSPLKKKQKTLLKNGVWQSSYSK